MQEDRFYRSLSALEQAEVQEERKARESLQSVMAVGVPTVLIPAKGSV